MRKPVVSLAALALGIATSAAAAEFNWNLPPGFPKPVVPVGNPMNAAKVELGRYLFYDQRMSVNGKESCATCHRQELAFTDGRARAQGATGQLHPRSAMSLVNVAYAPVLTWANPTLRSLEEQALGPMLGADPIELGLKGHEQEFLKKVEHDPVYQRLFPEAFPDQRDVYMLENVTKAIAAFERTIISLRSPYDRYRWGGDMSAISASAKRGELVFFSSERGACFRCHDGWNFSPVRYDGQQERSGEDNPRGQFFNTSVSAYPAPNRGIYEYSRRPADLGKFRAPTLRNIAVTAPYMHDGNLPTLEAVMDHYATGGKYDDPNKSPIVQRIRLSDAEKGDLLEFLRTLTDEELLRDPRWSNPWTAHAEPAQRR